MIGNTTTTVTVMRMDVAVAACARLAISADVEVLLLTSAFRLLAWLSPRKHKERRRR